MYCFEYEFSSHHHPRTSFSRELVIAADTVDKSIELKNHKSPLNLTTLCGFCLQSDKFDRFIPDAFVISNKFGLPIEYTRVHESCCLSTPDIRTLDKDEFLNVSSALKRSRAIKCCEPKCKNYGASVNF